MRMGVGTENKVVLRFRAAFWPSRADHAYINCTDARLRLAPPPTHCCPYLCPYCTLTPSLPRCCARWSRCTLATRVASDGCVSRNSRLARPCAGARAGA